MGSSTELYDRIDELQSIRPIVFDLLASLKCSPNTADGIRVWREFVNKKKLRQAKGKGKEIVVDRTPTPTITATTLNNNNNSTSSASSTGKEEPKSFLAAFEQELKTLLEQAPADDDPPVMPPATPSAAPPPPPPDRKSVV